MVPRTILVPVFGADGDVDTVALSAAVAVARQYEAHVEALFVVPDPKDSVLVLGDGLSTLMVEEIIHASETVWMSRARAARGAFDRTLLESGLPLVETPEAEGRASIGWRETVGRADEEVTAAGRLADLIVFAGTAGQHDVQTQQVVEAALLFSGRPVLLAPPGLERLGDAVAVAWNGKIESARAVAAALPILQRAARVHILTADTTKTAGSQGRRLAAQLAWHGIAATVETIEPGSEAVGAGIQRRAGAFGADLLVMGAYGHSRVREMILGGVTRHILAHPGTAVLMIH